MIFALSGQDRGRAFICTEAGWELCLGWGVRGQGGQPCGKLPPRMARAWCQVSFLGHGLGTGMTRSSHIRMTGRCFLLSATARREAPGLGLVVCRTVSPRYAAVLAPIPLNEAVFGGQVREAEIQLNGVLGGPHPPHLASSSDEEIRTQGRPYGDAHLNTKRRRPPHRHTP